MEEEESEPSAARAPPSTPTSERCSVSGAAGDKWRDEDTSWLQRTTAPWWIPAHPRDEGGLFPKYPIFSICFSEEANELFQNTDPHPLEHSNTLHRSGRPLGLA